MDGDVPAGVKFAQAMGGCRGSTSWSLPCGVMASIGIINKRGEIGRGDGNGDAWLMRNELLGFFLVEVDVGQTWDWTKALAKDAVVNRR